MFNDFIFSTNSNEWSTPQYLFDQLNDEFSFTLDPCANHENAKCKKYFTIDQDGLKQSWSNEVVFCNPPYGTQLKHWIKKAYSERLHSTIVLLIPARTDTKYFHDYLYNKAEIRFIKGRLKFNEYKYNAPFPSMICIFKNN